MLFLLSGAAAAEDMKAGPISVKDAWSRAKPEGTDVGVGYLTITNDGDAPDRLVSAEAAFAGQAEIHQMTMNNGVMQMRPVPEGVTVPAKGKLVFSPPDVHGSQRPAKGGRYRRRQFDLQARRQSRGHFPRPINGRGRSGTGQPLRLLHAARACARPPRGMRIVGFRALVISMSSSGDCLRMCIPDSRGAASAIAARGYAPWQRRGQSFHSGVEAWPRSSSAQTGGGVVAAQESEIEMMQTGLKAHGQSRRGLWLLSCVLAKIA